MDPAEAKRPQSDHSMHHMPAKPEGAEHPHPMTEEYGHTRAPGKEKLPCGCDVDCLACKAERMPTSLGPVDRMQDEYDLDTAHHAHRGHKTTGEHAGHGMDHEAMMADPTMAEAMEKDMRRRFWIALALTIPTVAYSRLFTVLFRIELPAPLPPNYMGLIFSTPIVWYSGWIFISGTYRALRRRQLNMAVLIATGVLAAYLFSVGITFTVGGDTFYEAAAFLVTFVLFGHWMEIKARKGTSDALRALFDLVPPQARVIRNDQETLIPTAEVVAGDLIALRPGDKVPVDGEVVEGETAVDESLVTGESIPVAKAPGDGLIGGSINQSGAVRFTATKVGNETALGQIIKLVETAQTSKAPGQRIADKAAAVLVVVAIGAGLVTFGVWFGLLRETALFSLTFAISAVVIACPDALGLATPTAVAVGTGLGARHNILIKDATTLEGASKIDAVVLDKTGTLTEGKPKVTDVIAAPGFDEKEMLKLEAAVEARSSHPLADAITAAAEKKGLGPLPEVAEFENVAGHGVRATVEGKAVVVGTRRMMADDGIDVDPFAAELDRLAGEGKSVAIVAVDGKIAGLTAAADVVRPSAARAIEGMKALGIQPAMITGDNRRVAEAVAGQLGIERVFAEVLPQDKASYVKRLQDEGFFVAMVGDGVNDAPALAQSDIGIAIGAGTDVAIETARIVLMRSDPADVLVAIRLSRATVGKMKQNLFWASFYNLLAVPVAAGVLYPSLGIILRPEISALLMSISSIIVATNAVLLKRVESRLVAV